jgi:hypothetical protein
MADILPPRIESISDPHSGPRDQPAPNPRVKAAVAAKSHLPPPLVPAIGSAEEEEKHELDELA